MSKYVVRRAVSIAARRAILKFLRRVLLEAKLRKIERHIGRRVTTVFAFIDVNLTEVHLDHMGPRAKGDLEFEQMIKRTATYRII